MIFFQINLHYWFPYYDYHFERHLKSPNSKCFLAETAKALDNLFSNPWVMDLGATGHMPHNAINYEAYKPFRENQKVTVPDGSPITIHDHGSI